MRCAVLSCGRSASTRPVTIFSAPENARYTDTMGRLLLACAGCFAAFVFTLPLACGSAFTAASSSGNDGGPDDDALFPIEGATEGGDGTISEGGSGEGATPGDGSGESSAPETIVYVSR